jgi:hypothetical protein
MTLRDPIVKWGHIPFFGDGEGVPWVERMNLEMKEKITGSPIKRHLSREKAYIVL